MTGQHLLHDLGEKLAAIDAAAAGPPAVQRRTLRAAWESLRVLAVELRRREAAILGPRRTMGSGRRPAELRPAPWTIADDDLLVMPWPEGWLLRRALNSVNAPAGADADGDVAALLEDLRPDLVQALTLRFGLDGGGPRNYHEVGAALGVQASAAHHKVNQALRELKRTHRRPASAA